LENNHIVREKERGPRSFFWGAKKGLEREVRRRTVWGKKSGGEGGGTRLKKHKGGRSRKSKRGGIWFTRQFGDLMQGAGYAGTGKKGVVGCRTKQQGLWGGARTEGNGSKTKGY